MKNRFKLNDTVIYGGHGACTLVEITSKDFGGEAKDYYVLRPAFSGSSMFYVPVDSEPLTAKMHGLKNASELTEAVKNASALDWRAEDRARQNELKAIVDCGGTEKLISAYRLLLTKQREFADDGKKLRAADDRVMRDIEKLLIEEFSFVFEINKDSMVSFVMDFIVPNEK